MKIRLTTAMLLLTFLIPGVVQADDVPAPCKSLMNDIARKIIRNGIPATDFKLEAVPNGEIDPAQHRVVGTCGFGSHRVVYTRSKDINPGGSHAYNNGTDAGSTVNRAPVVETTPEPEPVKTAPANDDANVAGDTNLADDANLADETTSTVGTQTTETVNEAETQAQTATESPDSNEGGQTASETAPDVETVEPVKPQPKIIITSPENDPSFQSKMADADNSIIIHR